MSVAAGPPVGNPVFYELGCRLTLDQIGAIRSALRTLSQNDGDRAVVVNGKGFSRFDTRIGHELAARAFLSRQQLALAAKIVRKYRRQLPDDVAGVIEGIFAK